MEAVVSTISPPCGVVGQHQLFKVPVLAAAHFSPSAAPVDLRESQTCISASNGKFLTKQLLDEQSHEPSVNFSLLKWDNLLMNSKENVSRLNVRLGKSTLSSDG